ncbi:MAG: squalene/phytoene synthase family protein [Gemmobacter sp.]|jgi:phytoene/squalene synthetase|nr:squalene/phytoene synthase family protein [Gemmobacter sp.]
MSLEACAERVRRADPERFAALMAAPPADRPALAVLYALNAELARAPWVSAEPMLAEMRLQWWRDVIAAETTGPAVPHEVATPLGALIRSRALPSAVLDGMVTARIWDVWRAPHADEAALWAYLDATGGGLMWLAAHVLGTEPAQESAARAVGQALGLANYLRAVPQLESRGRIPLPDPRPEAVAALAHAGLTRLEVARGQPLPKGALLAAHLARPVLLLVARAPERVAAGTLILPEFTKRWRLLWQGLTGRL